MKELGIILSAEQVHKFTGETRKLGVAASIYGGVTGNAGILAAGTTAWLLSMGADILAVRKIKRNSGQKQ